MQEEQNKYTYIDAVRRVDPSDLPSINEWLKLQNHPEAALEDLPTLGYIVPGVGAGFVRNCETGIGMLDSFVTNPKATSEQRDAALDELFKACLNSGFKGYIAFTAEEGIAYRLDKFKFVSKSYKSFIRAGK